MSLPECSHRAPCMLCAYHLCKHSDNYSNLHCEPLCSHERQTATYRCPEGFSVRVEVDL